MIKANRPTEHPGSCPPYDFYGRLNETALFVRSGGRAFCLPRHWGSGAARRLAPIPPAGHLRLRRGRPRGVAPELCRSAGCLLHTARRCLPRTNCKRRARVLGTIREALLAEDQPALTEGRDGALHAGAGRRCRAAPHDRDHANRAGIAPLRALAGWRPETRRVVAADGRGRSPLFRPHGQTAHRRLTSTTRAPRNTRCP